MVKMIKSKRQMRMSFREIATEAANGNEDIRKALEWVDASHCGKFNTFGTANGTVSDYLSVYARPSKKRTPIKQLGYCALWYVFVNLIGGPDSQKVKDTFVPVLARSLAYETKKKAKAGKTLAMSDMVRLMDITNRKCLEGMFSGESLHAVNYMMRTTAKQFGRQVKAEKKVDRQNEGVDDNRISVAIKNTMVLETLRKRGVRMTL
ncbi:MAG: hypothetical protein AB7E52_09520 [Bdellovibrionales bacterium]